MSSEGINFVRERRRRLSKSEVTDRQLLRMAMIALSGVFVAFLVVMGVQFGLTFQVNQAKAKQASLKRTVLSQEEIEKSYVLFANKLKSLGEIFTTRTNKQQAISYYTALFGPQVLMKEINYEADAGILSFGLNSPSIFLLQQVFDKLDSAEVQQLYPTLNKSELRRQNDGSYDMTVTVELLTKPSPSPKAAASPAATSK